MAVNTVAIYSIIFLGSCSPIHIRACTGFCGIMTVFLSYACGSAFMFLIGGQVAGVHSLLPFLLIGIGVDDMFVIANAID